MATPQGKFNQKVGNQGMRHTNPTQKFAVNNNQRNGKGALKGKPMRTKLIGFPDDFEFTKFNFYPNKANGVIAGVETEGVHNSQKEANGSNVIPGNSFAHENNFGQYLNKDQYANLVEQVTRDVQMKQGSTSASGFNAGAIAGTNLHYSGSCFSVFNSSTWIIDSGASEHMCFDSKFFTSLSPLLRPISITLPNSFRIISTNSPPLFPNFPPDLSDPPPMPSSHFLSPATTPEIFSPSINTGSHIQESSFHVSPTPTSSSPDLSPAPPRRSARISHRPEYLYDYV
ncbi:hypothetical protein H5410_001147 [Solanum commersonii]|uniref:Retrovirus-related Pol polyprotein from transposon TNT 1-94-like beta-barrel domain-containing protein n=1 Tax=Solanum commersonii TaxID=4109 RepID=A0A9J6AY39_SOLCO|nr:hypothetical protein H5410_001147 [Solanum commersonii]